MKIKNILAVFPLTAMISVVSHAAIVDNGLSGNINYDGWDVLGGVSGYGSGTTWATPMGSMELGSGDAGLDRISGGHYSASFGLYSPSGTSVFSVVDSTAVAGLETVVISIDSLLGADDIALLSNPVLNFNSGSQQAIADYSFSTVLPTQTGTPFGDVDPIAYTFQWDLTGLGVTSFAVNWEHQVHSSLRTIQLEQSDTFSVANAQVVPVPAAAWLFGSACVGIFAVRRKLVA